MGNTKAVKEKLPVQFTWNIHWSCNYRCSYCFFDGRWVEFGRRNVYKTVNEWMVYWQRIFIKYGRCIININGGEPFAYPNFVELLVRLSAIHGPINVTTNTSLHLDEFAKRINPHRVSISISFHPQYHALEDFLKTLRFLRAHNANIGCLNIVAWPPFLKDLPNYIKHFEEMGESLKVIPFVGAYEGKKYPEDYDPEQKEFMGLTDNWLDSKRHKGSLCNAGHGSALLLPTGKVARCGQIGDRHLIGDFFDPYFALMKEPMPCDVEFCPCDEWKILVDKETYKPGARLP